MSKNLVIEICKSTLYKLPAYQLNICDGCTGHRLHGPKLAGSYTVLGTVNLEGEAGRRTRKAIRDYLEEADARDFAQVSA